MFKSLAKHADLGLLIGRLGVGVIFIVFGWQKLSGGQAAWTHYGHAMASLGINFMPNIWGLVAALSEFAGGILAYPRLSLQTGSHLDCAHHARRLCFNFSRASPQFRAILALDRNVLHYDRFRLRRPGKIQFRGSVRRSVASSRIRL